MGTGYDDWLKSLSRVGVIGMYDEESQKDLDRITGCTEHKELGTSSDGKYKYYLSTNKDADADLLKDVEGIEVTLTEMTPFQMLSAFDQPQEPAMQVILQMLVNSRQKALTEKTIQKKYSAIMILHL